MLSRSIVVASAFPSFLAVVNSDWDSVISESLVGKTYDFGEFSKLPDQLDLTKLISLPLKRICVVPTQVGCLVELGSSLGVGAVKGLKSTDVSIEEVAVTESAECTLENHDLCRELDMSMVTRMKKLATITKGSIYVSALHFPIISLDGNLNINFRDLTASTSSSILGSAVVGEKCLAEKPLLNSLSFDNIVYDGITFDFDFGSIFRGHADLSRFVTEQQLEDSLKAMFAEDSDLTAHARFETTNFLSNLWRKMINSLSSRVKFDTKEPGEALCGQ